MRLKFELPILVLASFTGAAASHVGAAQPAPSLDVPFVPTPPEVVEAMLTMAKVTSADTVYDLGSGDGRVVITAAERYGARGIGFDIDPVRVGEARANAKKEGVTQRVSFRQADLFTVDLSPATVLTLYLLPEVNLRLRQRILALRPGTRVVSHDFDMGDWEPDSKITLGQHTVYGWIVPARAGGTWRWRSPLPGAEHEYEATFEQDRQKVSSTKLRRDGAEPGDGRGARLNEAKLVGDRLTFTVTDRHRGRPVTMRYAATLNGTHASGTVDIEDGGSPQRLPWTATR